MPKTTEKKGKHHPAHAASFVHFAKRLRVRARNHQRAGKAASKRGETLTADFYNWRAAALMDVIEEANAEATRLREIVR